MLSEDGTQVTPAVARRQSTCGLAKRDAGSLSWVPYFRVLLGVHPGASVGVWKYARIFFRNLLSRNIPRPCPLICRFLVESHSLTSVILQKALCYFRNLPSYYLPQVRCKKKE